MVSDRRISTIPMTPAAERLRFGVFEFDPGSGELFRGSARVSLRPQPSRVLALLASRPSEVVSHEELRRAIWGDGVHVDFEQALENALWEIRRALGDAPHASRYVETVAKRGYRFVAPVTVLEPAPVRLEEGARSIAVLPLVSLSGVPEHSVLAGELTDELITCLAREPLLRVVSRTTVLRYRELAGDVAEIARQLGVSLLLEGTVVVAGTRARVNVQLIDARADRHLWADSFERPWRDRLGLEQRVAARVVAGVRGALGPPARSVRAASRASS